MFGLLVFLFCWGVQKKLDGQKIKKTFLIIAFTALFYGIIMEFVQRYFIPNRSFDSGDIIADALGCFVGWWFALKWGSSVKK